jgi:hypothetical protein
MISTGSGFVAFIASVNASSVCDHLSKNLANAENYLTLSGVLTIKVKATSMISL